MQKKTKEQRLQTRRDWYSRTKSRRRAKIQEYDRRTYWKHRDEKRAKTQKWHREHPERIKVYSRRKCLKKYRLSERDYQAMLRAQNGVCAICQLPPAAGKRLHVDHCHKTGINRGLLCSKCNVGIACFKDDPMLLLCAAKYVANWSRVGSDLRLGVSGLEAAGLG